MKLNVFTYILRFLNANEYLQLKMTSAVNGVKAENYLLNWRSL